MKSDSLLFKTLYDKKVSLCAEGNFSLKYHFVDFPEGKRDEIGSTPADFVRVTSDGFMQETLTLFGVEKVVQTNGFIYLIRFYKE